MNALTAARLSGYAFFSSSGALVRGLSRRPRKPPGPNLYADAGDLSRVHAAWCLLRPAVYGWWTPPRRDFQPVSAGFPLSNGSLITVARASNSGVSAMATGVKIFELGQQPQGDVSGIAAVHVVRDDTKHLYEEVSRTDR